MIDWRLVTAQVEEALTLDEASLAKLLGRGGDGSLPPESRRLLEQLRPRAGFMATSVEGSPTDAFTLRPGDRLGVWRIREPVGLGGSGAVYRACRDDGLYEQDVALKVLETTDERPRARFDEERRKLARMNHPGIARIVDGGVGDDDRPWLAMEFVEGATIDAHARERSLSRTGVVRLMLDLAAAVAHAHGNLVVHSDIKATNVLVDRTGAVRLIDFGIATAIDADRSQSRALTLATAAPEQLRGDAVTVATDVFALGVLLHQLVAGALPSRRADGGMDAVALGDPDLLAIVERCLAFDPADRYPSVDALADDLRALLEHRPVQARDGGRGYRLGRFLRRNALASGLAAATATALVTGLFVSMSFAERASRERDQARENLARAEFFLERANLFYAAQNAYSDALQRSFGGQADVARQTEILKARWEEAHALREEDPELAAQLGHAIGRHFLFRNDYPTAISILEPWVEEGYGPEDLVLFGAHLLAIAYLQTDQADAAVPQLRRIERWYAASYDRGSADHIAAATQLAGATREEADLRNAEALLEEGLRTDQGPSVNMYFQNQLSRMRRIRGDLAGAHDALREVVAIIEANPLMDISGTDTGRLNLAEFDFWRGTDPGNAERLARAVAFEARASKGESAETGRALVLLALIEARRDRTRAALEMLDDALETLLRFDDPGSAIVAAARISRVEILADAGALTQAATALEEARRTLPELRPESEQGVRLALAEAEVIAAHGTPEDGRAHLAADAPPPGVIASSPLLVHRRARLETLGLWPTLQSAAVVREAPDLSRTGG
ncbi:MAG: serine/threonine-protein kinase [Pseudomonadales bacterium]|jgi:hypothetical protein|nr:serine/threonine-protein kinase [Pseudomonadales bacterium]